MTNISISVPVSFIEWSDRQHADGAQFRNRSHMWEYAMARFIIDREGQDAYDKLVQG